MKVLTRFKIILRFKNNSDRIYRLCAWCLLFWSLNSTLYFFLRMHKKLTAERCDHKFTSPAGEVSPHSERSAAVFDDVINECGKIKTNLVRPVINGVRMILFHSRWLSKFMFCELGSNQNWTRSLKFTRLARSMKNRNLASQVLRVIVMAIQMFVG